MLISFVDKVDGGCHSIFECLLVGEGCILMFLKAFEAETSLTIAVVLFAVVVDLEVMSGTQCFFELDIHKLL